MVFFRRFKIYSGLWPLSVSPRCQCVCTQWQVKHQHSTSAELAQFRKPQNFKENTQYLMNTLYLYLSWLRRKGEERLRAGYEEMWVGVRRNKEFSAFWSRWRVTLRVRLVSESVSKGNRWLTVMLRIWKRPSNSFLETGSPTPNTVIKARNIYSQERSSECNIDHWICTIFIASYIHMFVSACSL